MSSDTTIDPCSSNFSYKKYSLQQLDNWVNDALNCDDLSPQDIYDTIVKCVDESVEYHKKYYTKSVELLSLLEGHRSVNLGVEDNGPWNYTEKKREYELKEREFERKRTMLDAQSTNFPDYTELPDD